MKFKIKATLLIVIAVVVCLFATVQSFKGKSKREESMMEFINNFFSKPTSMEDAEQKSIGASNLEGQHRNRHHGRHRKRHGKGYRFKEKIRGRNHQNSTASTSNSTAAGSNSSSGNSSEAQGSSPILSDWFMISSPAFKDGRKFPPVMLPNGTSIEIHVSPQFFRINSAFEKATDDKPPTNKFFWFRLSGLNIYYSLTSTDINILGAIAVTSINSVKSGGEVMVENTRAHCFTVGDTEGSHWKLCAQKEETTTKWICAIKKLLEIEDSKCPSQSGDAAGKDPAANVTVVEKNITQPIIIIPLPSRHCNEDWNYQQNGNDWECDCSEGREQAPIDLPSVDKAIDSPVRPIFEYDEVSMMSKITTLEGQLKQNSPMKIKLVNGSLRIFHQKFGKVVTMDGAVYYAQEIVIHTPAEHTINGKTYDMEIQIVHYGQTKGDIAKQLILSFVVEKTPGVYNKFIDDLDFFNLPNPVSPERDLTANVFIPKIFYSADDTDVPVMKPFSFYTYQGSLTAPPCTENTIIYVASKPISLGSTAVQLFQEALRVPDLMDSKGDVIVSDWIPMSNRKTQPLNGRPVFHYNHEKYCGPDPAPNKIDEPTGHYEKITKAITKYFYVNGPDPSGIPNAFVVSEKEALGKTDDKKGGSAPGAPGTPGSAASQTQNAPAGKKQ